MSRSSKPPNVVACLDLHGKRRKEAIHAFTCFAEKHSSNGTNSWVKVITGTGQHSGDQGGPVLRSALEQLLQKRNMEHRYEKGCFYVNCCSGHVLVCNDRQVDRKIQLVPSQDGDVNLISRQRHHQETLDQSSGQLLEPLPHQVAKYDATIQSVKMESVTDFNKRQQRHIKTEKLELEQALIASKKQQETELEQAMSLSKLEFAEMESHEEFQHAISLSKLEYKKETKDKTSFQLELQEALELSIHGGSNDEEDEEEELQRVISVSLHTHKKND